MTPLPITYFKRYRMEIDLLAPLMEPQLTPGYSFVGWHDSLLDLHAEVKYLSFVDEVDSLVFDCLATRLGCRHLMEEIRDKPGFEPGATWLLQSADGYCGTVQGIRNRHGWGSIQNLGVTPEHRGLGLGGALLMRALVAFQTAGLTRAVLEVTAQNDAAIRLYRRLGFRRRKTLYKAVQTLCKRDTVSVIGAADPQVVSVKS